MRYLLVLVLASVSCEVAQDATAPTAMVQKLGTQSFSFTPVGIRFKPAGSGEYLVALTGDAEAVNVLVHDRQYITIAERKVALNGGEVRFNFRGDRDFYVTIGNAKAPRSLRGTVTVSFVPG